MDRPVFTPEMSVDEFRKWYWYKTELEEICAAHGLPTCGTKYELVKYVTRLLDGEPARRIRPVRKSRRPRLRPRRITAETKILESGFCLNSEARAFFCTYFGMDKFSFKKSMGVKMREIQAQHDTEATIQDLIDVYEKAPDLTDDKEEQTYQWNNFVRDFCKDDMTRKYPSPMKVAAFLWRKVRDSDQEKKYSRELLLTHQEEIASCCEAE